jgi:general secretion pathway protein N
MTLIGRKRILLVCVAASISFLTSWTRPAYADAVRLDDLAQTRERPLFSASRRPPPKPVESVIDTAPPPPPVVELPPPSLVLVGVIVGTNAKTIVIRRLQDTKSLRLALDDDIDGWKVASIGLDAVTFQHEERTFSLAFPKPIGVSLK